MKAQKRRSKETASEKDPSRKNGRDKGVMDVGPDDNGKKTALPPDYEDKAKLELSMRTE